MKNRKATITILLILAILVLGVGYALATKTLTVDGTLGAVTDDSNFKVEFTSATVGTKTIKEVASVTPVTAASVDTDVKTKATFTVDKFTTKGDTVTFLYGVTNLSEDLKANVTATLNNEFENKDYFDVEISFQGGTETASKELTANGGTDVLEVVVTCKKTPTEVVTAKKTTGIITLAATASEN